MVAIRYTGLEKLSQHGTVCGRTPRSSRCFTTKGEELAACLVKLQVGCPADFPEIMAGQPTPQNAWLRDMFKGY